MELSLCIRDSARFAAAVGIARENSGSHDHGPIKASLNVAPQTFAMHSNHRHAPSSHLGSCILKDLQEMNQQKQCKRLVIVS